MRAIRGLLVAGLLVVWATNAMAVPVLDYWGFNINGIVNQGDGALPDFIGGELSGGLGALTWSAATAGDYKFVAFLDYELSESTNSWVNETGGVHYPQNPVNLNGTQKWHIEYYPNASLFSSGSLGGFDSLLSPCCPVKLFQETTK